MRILSSRFLCRCVTGLALAAIASSPSARAQQRHNVIIFVADGLRRGSVNAEHMPTFLKVRTSGVDFRNSHSAFPTFTTANASVIATGHGLGDTGDYSNAIYPGVWLAKPDPTAVNGTIAPFLENDEILANMNSVFDGNYLGERTLLSVAREKGFNVASVGKLGPTAIQQIEALSWDQLGVLNTNGAIIVDDSTSQTGGLLLPTEISEALDKADLALDAPSRSNGYGESSIWNNGFAGDAQTPGTHAANNVQAQWFADVTTKVLLPKFAAEKKPWLLLFWSREPDGSQHNHGDSLQNLTPGINGETSTRGLQTADRCLKQLLDWLDAHPAVKATTDVLITSDHGFATISRRELASDGTQTAEVSAAMTYEVNGKEKPQPAGTLPTGFLAVDLGVREHMRVFDPTIRATTGSSAYAEIVLGGEKSQHPANGSALLGEVVKKVDGSDAQLIVASNGGSDLIYAPGKSVDVVRQTIATLAQLDYVGGIFVDDFYCPAASDCPGALPLSAVGLVGKSKVPRPAIVVTYKVFYATPGDLQSAKQISDTSLQEGQGMHGGFGREQTLNNMAAMGPDFKTGFVDDAPMGNIDIVPTLAHILGIEMPAVGTLKGRVLHEALASGAAVKTEAVKTMVSAPVSNGASTVLEYQELDGVKYYDKACLVTDAKRCE
ncbi:MAG TPA: alkaline phosphatase family protein [Acidobacteriaceae bacterium]